jgi:intermediate filament protein if
MYLELVLSCYFLVLFQTQEFRTGAAKNNMETVHAKEETKRLRGQLTDLRSKLADMEGRVSRRVKDH